MQELGYAGFDTSAWFGFMVPAKTPKSVIDRLYGEIAKVVETKDVQDRLAAAGLTLSLANPQAFGDQIRIEIASWAKVIKTANIKEGPGQPQLLLRPHLAAQRTRRSNDYEDR
jgi:tripartite-type tricarboxylate transporter receptor subunit TctC